MGRRPQAGHWKDVHGARGLCLNIYIIVYSPFFDGAIAKWLRRLIRNQFPFRGAGSSPAGVVRYMHMNDLFCLRILLLLSAGTGGSIRRTRHPACRGDI